MIRTRCGLYPSQARSKSEAPSRPILKYQLTVDDQGLPCLLFLDASTYNYSASETYRVSADSDVAGKAYVRYSREHCSLDT